ncbi:Zn-ribbon domain-containing OB-fold protein [Rhodococcus sp. NPDC019627]|uniref:Zn-ribbon domain-containing OB-fold protein n=1 Tax=Rhodococcus TaxID=1827 RepID=UPI0013201438|nr:MULTISPECIES: OB-fold domain-containing protein [Rhodococcus]MDV7351624.1 OB-fold domain-containing protein [Rhodococcus oxybenzonivorans]QHE69504.1 hypothetical protein GFS60_03072 [Rhodococcus sp. WAY2]
MSPERHSRGHALAKACALMIQRCRSCTTLLAPLMATCSTCQGSDFEQVPSCGVGSIVSSKSVERERRGRDRATAPCTIAIVELDEGPWVYTWIDGEVPASSSQQPVRVEFRPAAAAEQLPVFAIRHSSEG